MDTEDAIAPMFKAIRSFVFRRAVLDQEMLTFDSEVSGLGSADEAKINNGTTSTSPEHAKSTVDKTSKPSTSSTSPPSASVDDVAELSKQFKALALQINSGRMGGNQGPSREYMPNNMPSNVPPINAFVNRRRAWACPWCDSYDHMKEDCASLAEAIQAGVVRID